MEEANVASALGEKSMPNKSRCLPPCTIIFGCVDHGFSLEFGGRADHFS